MSYPPPICGKYRRPFANDMYHDADIILAACDVEANFMVVKVSPSIPILDPVADTIVGIPIQQPSFLYAAQRVSYLAQRGE